MSTPSRLPQAGRVRPVPPRICHPFREAGLWFRVADWNFELTCPCGVKQRADKLRVREGAGAGGGVTLYECPHCDARLIGVVSEERAAAEIAAADEQDGHYTCGFVFGSAVDVFIWPAAAKEPWLELPRRPRFFRAFGCDEAAAER